MWGVTMSRSYKKCVVEVFIRNEDVPITVRARKVSEHPCVNLGCIAERVEKIMPREDGKVLALVKKQAIKYDYELKVVDVNTFLGKLKARLRRNKKCPAVVLQRKKYWKN